MLVSHFIPQCPTSSHRPAARHVWLLPAVLPMDCSVALDKVTAPFSGPWLPLDKVGEPSVSQVQVRVGPASPCSKDPPRPVGTQPFATRGRPRTGNAHLWVERRPGHFALAVACFCQLVACAVAQSASVEGSQIRLWNSTHGVSMKGVGGDSLDAGASWSGFRPRLLHSLTV